MNLLKIMKALSDENRLRIFNLINQKTMCVCEIEAVLNITQSNVSRHLAKLKDAEIIEIEKRGQFIFHRINPKAVDCFPFLISLSQETMNNYKNDLLNLNELSEKGMVCGGKTCK